MARPKPTFLTIPLEVRNKIYGYALEAEEFLVCECPKNFTNEMGLCDMIKMQAYNSHKAALHAKSRSRSRMTQAVLTETCGATRDPRNSKTPLVLLCKQSADELKDLTRRLPILVFCSMTCCESFLQFSTYQPNHISRMDIWAVKIKTYVDPQYDATGTLMDFWIHQLDEMHKSTRLTEKYALKIVSCKDTGYHPHSRRIVELYLANTDNCKRLQKLFAHCILSTARTETILKNIANKSAKKVPVEKEETDGQDKEEKMHPENSVGDVSKPFTKSAKRRLKLRAAEARAKVVAASAWSL